MNTNSIDALLEKYFEGETSIPEEKMLKSYFNSDSVAKEHEQFKKLFNYYSESQKLEIKVDHDIPDIMTRLLDKYFEADTTIDEERTLKLYFNSEDVTEEHKKYGNLFGYYEASKQIVLNKDMDMNSIVDSLLEKYFKGDTNIEEEKTLKTYFNSTSIAEEHKQYTSLFQYFSTAQAEKLEKSATLDLNSKAKKNYLKIVRKRMVAIAAVLVVLLASIFIMKNNLNQNIETSLTSSERIEAEEALETTMEALAMLGIQFNKGTESMQNVKELVRGDILKQ